MKKTIAALLALTLTLNMSVPIFADELASSSAQSEPVISEDSVSSVSSETEADLPTKNDQTSVPNENTASSTSELPETDNIVPSASSSFIYTVKNNEAEITAYTGADTAVIVPSSIDGYPVTSLTSATFSGNQAIISVILPDSIKELSNFTFWKCTSLTNVTLPSSLTKIGKNAFWGCTSLTSITLPNTVTSIGEKAFMECSSLSSVILSTELTSIGNSAFQDCAELTSIIIPSSVTSIGEKAFYDCIGLESISLPDNITTIPFASFKNCSSLASVSLPAGLETIEFSAFADCSSLELVEIPDGVSTIEETAFSGNTSLASITIPASVETLEPDIFSDCDLVTIYCYENSAAHQYALEQNIPFILLNTPTENDVEDFINRVYTHALDRTPSSEEALYWKNGLESGKESGASFVFNIFSSDELLLNNHSNRTYIIFLYNATFGREPDAAGLQYWLNELNTGVTRPNITNKFLKNVEFSANCNIYKISTGTISSKILQDANTREFVVRMYRDFLLRTPDSKELDFWYTDLRNQKISAYRLVYTFAFSNEVLARTQSDEEYISMLYNSFLGRPTDDSKNNYWLKALKKGTVSRVQVFDSFFNGAEFQKKLRTFGL